MGLTRSRTLFLIVLLALAVFSLRPETGVDGAIDALFAPARSLAVIAAPARWLAGVGDVHAGADDETARAEVEASRAFLAAQRSAARPTDAALRTGRGFVMAEVVARLEDQRDVVKIMFDPRAGVAPGMPVVCGEVYVGRVKALDPSPGRATVALVTGSTFRVGARAESGGDGAPRGAELVVGGLAPKRAAGEGLELAAQFIRDRTIDSGVVYVRESDGLRAEPYRELADGYVLGDLKVLRKHDMHELCVEARIAYDGGLSEVAVLCPDPTVQSDLSARDPFDAASWIETSPIVGGNPSPWRAAAVLGSGSDQGVTDHAAIAVGPRLLGRVTSAARFTSDAALLADAGFQLNVVASLDENSRPLALGRLTSHGVERGSDVLLLRSDTELPRPASKRADSASGAETASATSARHATLYTAAGDLGIPAGLWIGTVELPAREQTNGDAAPGEGGRGEHRPPSSRVLRVHAPQTRSLPPIVAVWRSTPGAAGAVRE
jgi:hypothetical protein